MTKKEFEKFLETKTHENPVQDQEAKKREWLASLAALYQDVEQWLAEYTRSRKIKIESAAVTLEEDYLGSYKAESRIITIGSDRVILKPIGTMVIAAYGRVDMDGPKGTVKLIRTSKKFTGMRVTVSDVKIGSGAILPTRERRPVHLDELVWKIATPPPLIRFIDLTPNSFFEALMRVVNG
jgi:hypothetical protein